MAALRLQFLTVFLFLQLFCIAGMSFDQNLPSKHEETRLILSNLGFSNFILAKAPQLSEIFEICQISITGVTSTDELFSILKSGWGDHLQSGHAYTFKEQKQLESLIRSLHLYHKVDETDYFLHDHADTNGNENNLMVYVGAHPFILCGYINDVGKIVRKVSTVLISASSRFYKSDHFSTCPKFQYNNILVNEAEYSLSLRGIMSRYLHSVSDNTQTVVSAYDDRDYISEGDRLRLELRQNPDFFNQFDRVVFVVPQPFGEEIRQVAMHYLNPKITTAYWFFPASQYDLGEVVMRILNLLKMDIKLQQQDRE